MRPVAAVIVLTASATAAAADELGRYEREAVAEAMKRLDLELEPDPEGKPIGEIHIVPLPVFPPNAGFLQRFNFLHRTTRPDVLERELLVQRGDLYDDALLRESERNMRDPFVINLLVITPVKSETPGAVDLLLVTRDVWSLRTNSAFENQQGTFTFLTLSLAENNFLGWRKQTSVVFEMDLGEYSIGPRYRDFNLLGSRLQLLVQPRVLFSRANNDFEGTQSETEILYPLWSLARTWSFATRITHKNNVERSFVDTEIRTFDNPDTPGVETIPQEFNNNEALLTTELTRAIGASVKQHLTFGYELSRNRPELRADFPGDDADRAAFARLILPRSELVSAAVVRYRIFTPRFGRYRNINTYDLPENQQLGPDATVELGFASELFGSTNTFLRYRASLGLSADIRGASFARAAVATSGRISGDRIVDQKLDVSAFASTPPIAGLARFVAAAAVVLQDNVEDNELFDLGGQTGLRGYSVGEFQGTSFARANAEIRTTPVPIWFIRMGFLAFFDVGHAANAVSDLVPHADFGVGMRLLAPQTAEDLYRIDWAIPTRGPNRGFPGRLSIGFQQAF
jgi:hypothetical protein